MEERNKGVRYESTLHRCAIQTLTESFWVDSIIQKRGVSNKSNLAEWELAKSIAANAFWKLASVIVRVWRRGLDTLTPVSLDTGEHYRNDKPHFTSFPPHCASQWNVAH